MKKSETNLSIVPSTLEQASHLFAAHQQTIYRSTDRMFAVLMSVQWLAGVIAALWIAPRTWIGTSSQTHIHVWAAVFLGGAISFFPIVLAIAKPGANSTRYVIATAQMLMSALLIYLTGGRIETHFHVFGSLAFLAFYRDWRVLVPATIVVAADHFLRGVFWPQSVYGVLSASEWRWLEHAGWVLFEDTFLFIAIKRSVGEMWGIAQRTAELNDNEERYRAVVEQTAEGLVLADVDTKRVLECNVAFADLLGYTLEEALTLTAYDFVVDERESLDRRSGSLLDRRVPINGERRFRRKDGSDIDVEVNVSVIFYGGKDVFCTIVRDIGERKQAEEALRESELRFRSVTHSASDAIISADSKGNIVFWNKGAESAFGYTKEEILGKPLTQLMPEEYRAAHEAGMKRFLATGEARVIGKTVELSGLRKDGTVFPFELSLATWCTTQGTFFTGIFRDITARKQAEEALRKAHDELETKVRERTSQLAATNKELQEEIGARKLIEDELRDSEERYRQIVECASDTIYRISPTGYFTFVNASAAALVKRSAKECIGLHFLELIREDYREQAAQFYLQQIKDKVPSTHFEFPAVAKDGTKVWIGQNVQLVIEDGQVVELQGMATDITTRKEIEHELVESERRYRLLFENNPLPMWAFDAETLGFLAVNDAAIQHYGYSREEFLGMTVKDIRPEEDVPTLMVSARDSVGDHGNAPGVWRHRKKDGTIIDVEVSWHTLDFSGRPAKLVLADDITDRKRAEEALKESQQWLTAIFDSSRDGIIVEENESIVYVNQSYAHLFGYEPDELMGQPVWLVSEQEPSERMLEYSRRRMRGEEAPSLYEFRGTRKDRMTVDLEASVSTAKIGAKTCIISLCRDITERKRMEAERQVMFEIIQGVIATADFDELLKLIHHSISKIVYAENCFVALHDPKTDLLSFEFWVDKFDPAPPPRPVGIGFSSYVLRTGKPILLTKQLTAEMVARGEVTPSGTSSPSWLGVPLGTPSRAIGVLAVQHYKEEHAYSERDLEFLTSVGSQIALAIERKRAETNLRETEDQLRQSQKMEGIGTLAGGIAHDFNNLMTAVTGYSELALRSIADDDSLRSKIEEIKKAGERAATLTGQLLAFSRKQILQPRVLDLNTVVTGMGRMLPRIIGEDIDLRIKLGASLGQIKADPGQIEQVLMNLAVNARDAMPDGGYLTIKTENVQMDGKFAQRHLVVEPGHYVILSVSDNGCGMDAETQAHIFEPFFTTKEVGKGTGLGLSTVYGIVKQSGGSIWVYSEVGKGTTFKIYLLRVDDIIEIEESGTKSRSVPRGRETILLVEDEDVVRDLSKEILEEYGYAVITAPNGNEGLRICKEFEGHIDLMITDVVMPRMGGRELADKVTILRPDTRILYMSGFTDDAVVRHGVVDDGLFFLQKPFSPDSLALKAREVLDHGGSSPSDGAALISLQSPMKHSETIRRN